MLRGKDHHYGFASFVERVLEKKNETHEVRAEPTRAKYGVPSQSNADHRYRMEYTPDTQLLRQEGKVFVADNKLFD